MMTACSRPTSGRGDLARALYGQVEGLPIISPHGRTDPAWFATNEAFQDATDLLLAPDHYLYRMLYSQGISLDALKVRSRPGFPAPTRARPGACWPGTSTCSAAPLCGSGSTTCSPRSSGSPRS